jgi:Transposase DDE domain
LDSNRQAGRGRFHLRPQRLAGDTVYGAFRLLKWLVDRKIPPHIPVWDKSTRSDGTFSRADFVFDRERNVYICPGGKLLHTTGTVIDGGAPPYRASKVDCDVRAFKMRCCPSTPMRYVPRDLHEDAGDVARALAKTGAYEQSRRERTKIEMPFAHMKRIFKLDRLQLRGLSGAEPAAPRQVPLPPAASGGSHLCGLGLPSLSVDSAARRHSGERHKLSNAQIRSSRTKQPGFATHSPQTGHRLTLRKLG